MIGQFSRAWVAISVPLWLATTRTYISEAETLRLPNRQISILNRVASQIPLGTVGFSQSEPYYYQPTGVTWRTPSPGLAWR